MLKFTELSTLKFIRCYSTNGEFTLSTEQINAEYDKSIQTFQLICNNLKEHELITIDVYCEKGTKIKKRVIKLTKKGEELCQNYN